MQANNKSDATQVYENATRVSKTGIKDMFKYLLKPLTIFSYHYFVEGIKAVQKDGPTKELEKLTNLSYDETIRIMEKCQKDGVRIIASEIKMSTTNSEFGKQKSLYSQKRITRYSRKIKQMSNFKANYPNIAKVLQLDKLIKKNEIKQNMQINYHKNKYYNIYFNKSKVAYMGGRIEELIEYRTGISQKLFNKNTQVAIEEISKEGMHLNSQQLKDLSDKLMLHEIGNVEVENFEKDYCIHEIPFSTFINIKDDLELSDIPYGVKIIDNNFQKVANIYFENKKLERYCELGFNDLGQIFVYGTNDINLKSDINSIDEIVSFKTKVGDEEKQTYSILSGKNYIMKRMEDECLWTVLKKDIKELIEKEKKRDVVGEELEKLHIFEKIEKNIDNFISKNINEIGKEAGD